MRRLLIPLAVAFLSVASMPLLSQRPAEYQRMPKGIELAQRPEDKPQPPEVKPDDPVKPKPAKHGKGHIPLTPEQSAKMHAARAKALGNHVEKLPKATAATWDCRTLGMVLPGNDQGQCGDCFGVSTADGASMALIMAGILPNDASKGRLSSQYGLDDRDAFEGGCNGGNGTQVIDYMIKGQGWPLTSDYGPYTASPGRLKPLTGMKLYKPVQWGYCTPGQEGGLASVQDIKNCMVKYGPINVSFDAGGCDSYSWPGVMKGRGNSVDHEVLCIGWDDSKNAFLGMNQWGDSWGGPNGTFWIDYSSYSWGTDAFWVLGSNGPLPPNPLAPVITVTPQVAQVGAAFSYQITATNSPTAYTADPLPAGLTVSATTGVISGKPTTAGTYTVAVTAINAAGTGTASLPITVGTTPPPPPNGLRIVSSTVTLSDGNTYTSAPQITGDTTLAEILKILNPPAPTPKTPEEILEALRKLLNQKP